MVPPWLCQHNSLWGHGVTWLWKFLFFTRLFSRQLSLLLSTLIWFRAWLCWQAEDKQPPSLALPSALHAGSHGQPLNLPPAPWKHQPSPGENQCFFLQQKSTQEKPHCNNVNVLKSLLGGDNAYLMVTTICIYINWNECFSHNCSLSWRNMKGKKKVLPHV